MDLFDAGDYSRLLPRRVRRLAALALLVGIAFVPPVKSWYLEQIEIHAEHITEEMTGILIPSRESPIK